MPTRVSVGTRQVVYIKKRQNNMPLNPLRVLEHIDRLVSTDFYASMECKLLPHSKPYTQKEAEIMADLLGDIYLAAHQIHCIAHKSTYPQFYKK